MLVFGLSVSPYRTSVQRYRIPGNSMPENAAEGVVEEQEKVPERKNCLFRLFCIFL